MTYERTTEPEPVFMPQALSAQPAATDSRHVYLVLEYSTEGMAPPAPTPTIKLAIPFDMLDVLADGMRACLELRDHFRDEREKEAKRS